VPIAARPIVPPETPRRHVTKPVTPGMAGVSNVNLERELKDVDDVLWKPE
jgi:hypothetical protein